MFEKLGNYMDVWMLPLLAVFVVGWLVGGGYLLRASLHRHLEQRRPPKLGQCVLHIFLAGSAAAMAGLVLMFLIYQIGSRLETRLVLPAVLAGALVALPVAYLLLFALLNLPARDTLSVATRPLAAVAALTIVVGAAAAIPAMIGRARQIDRNGAMSNLLHIHQAIVGSFARNFGKPPGSLMELVDSNYLDAKYLRSPGSPGRDIGFFYYSRPALRSGPDERILACDLRGSHGGRGRAFVLVNGRANWVSETEFQKLLRDPINREFAEALAEVEGN